MPEEFIESLIEQYDGEINNYTTFTEKIKSLVVEILKEKQLNVHSITARPKDRDSFLKKISSAEGKYKNLGDVTDLTGVRIITYFEDDVDKVAKYIEQQFYIDWDYSVDKRDTLDPDRFGYLSLHLIVKLLTERSQLIEYRRYPDFKAEIQIRSILQHAWAEIEHDLGYKTKLAVPAKVRRSFSRLAGLLEIADKEFISVRKELAEYENLVPEQIISTPQRVLIDKASLKAFILSNPSIKDIDIAIGNLAGSTLITKPDEYIENDLLILDQLDIKTIAQLEKQLKEHREKIIEFAGKWITGEKYETLNCGISLLYLFYVRLGFTQNINYIREMIDIANISGSYETAEEVLRTYNDIF